MRINLNTNAMGAGFPLPYWFQVLLNSKINEFIKEYQIYPHEAQTYFMNRAELHRLVKLFKDSDINVESYTMEGLSSWGLIIADNEPTVVEYKLIYGTVKDENKSI